MSSSRPSTTKLAVRKTDEIAANSNMDPALFENGAELGHNASSKEELSLTKSSAFKSLGWLDRFLALWILLAMAVGIILGNFAPGTGEALQKGEFVGVSIPIGKSPVVSNHFYKTDRDNLAVGLLVMMYPILCKVKYESLHNVFRERRIWVQIGFSIVVNWIIAPLLMVSNNIHVGHSLLIILMYSLDLPGLSYQINQVYEMA